MLKSSCFVPLVGQHKAPSGVGQPRGSAAAAAIVESARRGCRLHSRVTSAPSPFRLQCHLPVPGGNPENLSSFSLFQKNVAGKGESFLQALSFCFVMGFLCASR